MANNKNLENLHGWLITYNALSNTWMAAKRDNSFDLFNNYESHDVIKAVDFPTLQEIIVRTQGDPIKLKQLVNG